jgi:hypothetical protein
MTNLFLGQVKLVSWQPYRGTAYSLAQTALPPTSASTPVIVPPSPPNRLETIEKRIVDGFKASLLGGGFALIRAIFYPSFRNMKDGTKVGLYTAATGGIVFGAATVLPVQAGLMDFMALGGGFTAGFGLTGALLFGWGREKVRR